MKITVNEKTYQFKFGYGFLARINEKYSLDKNGIELRLGIGMIITNLTLGDMQTVFETLQMANETEKLKITLDVLDQYLKEVGAETLINDVIEELKKSEYTKRLVNQTLQEAQKIG
ncbi:tail assembly chaperone [Enterococcus sp. AZ109]|uniref:tail assembly chaperone n=1 Tax=Enterococcus sp. AZ109 TaxID=2774634 RepID=UPI003F1F3732